MCPKALAVPSFTRQTGLVCTVCHSNPPELTAFGRKFKLEGYTLTDKKADTTIDDKDLQAQPIFSYRGDAFFWGNGHEHTPARGAKFECQRAPYALLGR